MTRASSQYEYMSLDDFEELLADKPADLPSLQHNVLIERDEVDVQVFDRVQGGFLQRDALTALADILRLPAIDFEMPLSEFYRDAIPAAS